MSSIEPSRTEFGRTEPDQAEPSSSEQQAAEPTASDKPPGAQPLPDVPLRFRLVDLFYTMVLLALMLAMVVNENETREYLDQANLQSSYTDQLQLAIEAEGYTAVFTSRFGSRDPNDTRVELVRQEP